MNSIVIGALSVACAFCAGDPQKRMRTSGEVLSESMDAKDKGIPQDMLKKEV